MRFWMLLLMVTSWGLISFAQSGTLLTNQVINVNGTPRAYHLFVPGNTMNAPIVCLFHGHSLDFNDLLGLSGPPTPVAPYKVWLDIADQENIIVAIPNGLYVSDSSKGWNDCRADAVTNSQADDVFFISQLIDTLLAQYPAAPDQVYVNGTSNGGHLCIRLAEEIPEKIAAFAAVVAANAVNSECSMSTLPVSALFMNGTEDPILPFAGGSMASNRGEVISTDSTVQYWVNRNGANPNPVVTNLPNLNPADSSEITRFEYLNGSDSTCVVLYQINGGGHVEPSIQERIGLLASLFLGDQNGDIEMAEVVWDFFENKRNSVVALESPYPDPKINLYPNPCSDWLHIDWGTHPTPKVAPVLSNALGQQIATLAPGLETINLTDFPPGLYFLHIPLRGRNLTWKLIKQ